MQRALVHCTDDTYMEYFFTDSTCYSPNLYGSTKELLSHTKYPPDFIKFLYANYSSWALMVGEVGNAVFLGHTVADSVLAYGKYDTIFDWVQDVTRGILVPTALDRDPAMFGDLLEARSMKKGLAFLQDLGAMPRLPRERVLSPVVTLQGTEYWVLLLDSYADQG